jgi:hypothetical protein
MPKTVTPIITKAIPLSTPIQSTASTPAVLLTAAETWFLRAEASLRGINPNDECAEHCYETGVQTSFSQWGAGDASLYLTSKGKPTDYITYAAGPGEDVKAFLTTIPNFDDPASQDQQLACHCHSQMDCLLARRLGIMGLSAPYRISDLMHSSIP